MKSKAAHDSVPLPRSLRLEWALTISLGLLCALVVLVNRCLRHLGIPYSTPFLEFSNWNDFVLYIPRFRHFHQLDFFASSADRGATFMYPAATAMVYEAFYKVPRHPLAVFLLLTASLVGFLGVILIRAMIERNVSAATATFFVVTMMAFSYPFWFEYLLGNLEICIFLLIAFALLAFLKERFYVAAALIGLAASMKIFPFVYFALFLSKKKYRELAFGVLTLVVSNVASLWLLCPSFRISYNGIQDGLNRNRHNYMLTFLPVETSFDHSLFGFIKRLVHGHYLDAIPGAILSAYLALAAISGIVLYFLVIRKLPLLNQFVCLCVVSILLPPTSHDYTLIHLYLPWGLLVLYTIDTARKKQFVPGLFAALVCFAILFSPQSEVIHHKLGLGGQIKAVVLVILLIIALTRRWPGLEAPGVSVVGDLA